jgi:ribosome maturation factor RimP
MQPGYESLRGLDRDRLLSVVEPVLRAHDVEPVELIWRSDQRGWVLYLTVERPGTTDPAMGITLDLCADISRDLSAALDVAEVITIARYRLEVGSPGIDRALYGERDYSRFAGRGAKVKLRELVDGQRVLRGTLRGMDGAAVVLECDGKEHRIDPSLIESGRLTFDWQASRGVKRGGSHKGGRPGAAPRDR